MKKYTIVTTLKCNLRCTYCYMAKRDVTLTLPIAEKIIDFIYHNTPEEEKINLGFFGGEPFLEFEVMQQIVRMLEAHPKYDPERIELSVTTNGTIFDLEIASFLNRHRIVLCLSCDGPPAVHDLFRRFTDRRGSSTVVEKTIRRARETLPVVLLNAVYHPLSLPFLPETLRYLSSLGLRQIYLNPDFSAPWTAQVAATLPNVYQQIGDLYAEYYLQGDPHFISLRNVSTRMRHSLSEINV